MAGVGGVAGVLQALLGIPRQPLFPCEAIKDDCATPKQVDHVAFKQTGDTERGKCVADKPLRLETILGAIAG